MTTLPPDEPVPRAAGLHTVRPIAESFGVDPEGYDRSRPDYPTDLVARVIAESPGLDVLDVGCGTGLAARQFQAAGCSVLGVEPDGRMAEFARDHGTPVEVATFEAWDPAGRSFDAVIAAQSWHWVDPTQGVAKAALVLRPGGRLAIFGHTFEPPLAVAESLAAGLRRVVPDSPFANLPAHRELESYLDGYRRISDTIRDSGQFAEPELWRFDWEKSYQRDEWLALLPTTGGLTKLDANQLADILGGVGTAIDALGGSFTMPHTTLANVSVRIGSAIA